ncbi:RNA polymerase III-inhibiting protein maf1 [Varicellaria rhodocarpa]|nr:RNA polymerase III-inhibiting protein maf1 [Varicellaria rhodocarpa]
MADLVAKYVPIREFDDVTDALNFDTVDLHIIGGCDLYTTKASGDDRKLYKTVLNTLESQHKSVLKFSASLSPPQAKAAAASLNLARSSPFGSLSQLSSRRTFAYLIATLNASHPDYDFSHLLRPSDFRREKSLRSVMNTLDATLYNLRPRPMSSLAGGPQQWYSETNMMVPGTPGGSQSWNPQMWRIIDAEMGLKDCSIYRYCPDEDPYEADEGAIWSFDYFFFNKARKRVCYIYLRGLSIMSHGPVEGTPMTDKRSIDSEWSREEESGASKRASYWLGDRAGSVSEDFIEDDDELILNTGDDDDESRTSRLSKEPSYAVSTDSSMSPCTTSVRSRSKSTLRGISEDMTDTMSV